MIRFFLKTFIALAVIASFGWCYGLYSFLQRISHYEISNSKTEAIVIFTGGKGRIDQGFELLKIYPNTSILVSGVGHTLQKLPLEKSFQKDILGDISLGHDAQDTIGNAEETKKWVQNRRIKSIRLVTSHYHMPRSLLLLRRAIPDIMIIPHPIISENFQSDGWWNNQKIYRMMLAEYNKYIIVVLKGYMRI